MKITSASTTTKAAIRKKTTAKEGQLLPTTDGAYALDPADTKSKDDNNVVLASTAKNKAYRFRKVKDFVFEDLPVPVIDPPPLPVVYKNEAQSATATCGEGFTGTNTVKIEAGLFTGATQSESNALALAEANKQAIAGLKCVAVTAPPVPSVKGKRVQGFSSFTATGSINAGSDVLTLDAPIAQVGDMLAVFVGLTPILDVRVIEVSPGKVKLDKPVTVAAKNAKVVIDSTQVMIDYVRNNPGKKFDAKALGFGNEELFFRRVKWEPGFWNPLTEAWFVPENITVDLGDLTASSIPGAFTASFGAEYGIGDGNFQMIGGTINQGATEAAFAATWYKEIPEQNPWLFCPAVGAWTHKGIVKGVKMINVWAYGTWGDVDIEDCHVSNTADGIKLYNGFWFLTFGGKIINCSAKSEYVIRVLEIEGGDGGVVDGFKAVNGIAASNSSWNATFKRLDFGFTKNAATHNPALLLNPTLEIHDHIKGQAKNILVEDVNIVCEDFLDEEYGVLRGIVVKGNNISNVTIRRVKIVYPDKPIKLYRSNGAATSLHLGADDSLVEDFETNATLWEGFKKEDYLNSHDNTIISVTGKRCTLRRVKAKAAIVAQDTIVEDCEFEYGFTRI